MYKSAISIYLQQYQYLYPGIDLWYQKAQEDEIAGNKKVLQIDVFYAVEGLCVIDVKQGKLCHLSMQLALTGCGMGRACLNWAIKEIKLFGHNRIWGHGREDIINCFNCWSGGKAVKTLGKFGRINDLSDVEFVIPVREFPHIIDKLSGKEVR